jgi:IS1 family transposase
MRVAAFEIGTGLEAAKAIYGKVKALCPDIMHIFTDDNSCCYNVAFTRMGIKEPHTMTKAQTHCIESSNSRIRDNLARFNRRSKRFSKTLEMLKITLDLFIHRHLVIGNAL